MKKKKIQKETIISLAIGLTLGSAVLFVQGQAVSAETQITPVPIMLGTEDAQVNGSGEDQLVWPDDECLPETDQLPVGLTADGWEWDEIELLARLIEAEAEGEGEEGKRWVASVVLNRVDSDTFPGTITEVILQKTRAWQFSPVGNGRFERMEVTEDNIQIVLSELESRTDTNAIYFSSAGWPAYGTKYKKVGNHYFNR